MRELVLPSCAGTHRYNCSLHWWAIRSIMLCFLMTEEGQPRFLCPLPIYIFSWILKIQVLRCFSIWMTLPCCSESKCTSPCTPSWSESPSSRALSVSSTGFAFGTVQVRVSESQFTYQKVGILIAPSLVGSCANQMQPCVRGAQAPGKHTLSECSFLLPCLENWLHCFCMAVCLYNWLPHKTVLTMVSWLPHFCCSGTLYRVWHILVAQLMLNDWADG